MPEVRKGVREIMFVESGGNSLAEGDMALRKLSDMYAYVRKAACDWCIRVSKCNLEYPIGGRTARQKTQSAKMRLSLFQLLFVWWIFYSRSAPSIFRHPILRN